MAIPWLSSPKRLLIPVCTLLAGVGVLAPAGCAAQETTTVFVVRHADREGETDDLSPLGLARAAELVHVLGSAGISVVYHSDTVRNAKTAKPLADRLGIEATAYPPADTEALVTGILDRHRGERVFVVGHSNTVPEIVRLLGGPATPDIGHDVYDDLFVITRAAAGGKVETLHLKYGTPSPEHSQPGR